MTDYSNHKELNDGDINDLEEAAYKQPDSLIRRALCRVLVELRAERHKLRDPNYIYAHSRISRQALICRDAEIERLREELRKRT